VVVLVVALVVASGAVASPLVEASVGMGGALFADSVVWDALAPVDALDPLDALVTLVPLPC
jgi:hypothetical protein